MELQVVTVKGKEEVILLDSDMRIVCPVIDYLRFQAQKGRAPNTITANAQDLKCFWEFMEYKGYEYEKVTPLQISEFIGYLRWGTDNWSTVMREWYIIQRLRKHWKLKSRQCDRRNHLSLWNILLLRMPV